MWILNNLILTIFRFNTYLSKYPRVPKLQNSLGSYLPK